MWYHENDDAPVSGMSAGKNPAEHRASPEQAVFLRRLARELVAKGVVKAIAIPATPMLRWDYPSAAFVFDLPQGRVYFQRSDTRVLLFSERDFRMYPPCAGYQA